MSGGRTGAELGELGLHRVDHAHDVGAGLLLHDQADRVLVVQPRAAPRLGDAVLDAADVAHADRASLVRGHDQVGEGRHVLHAAHGAEHHLAVALVDAAAGDLDVLLLQRLPHLQDGDLVGGHAVGVDVDVDRALPAADHDDRADALHGLDALLDLLLRDLGDLAEIAVAGDDHAHDRRRVDVELLHDRRLGPFRETRDDGRDLVAHLLCRDRAVLAQQELHDDDGDAFLAGRAQDVDAFDGVDDLLDRLGDAALDLLDARALERGRDGDGREVDVREEVETEALEREPAEHDERHDEHGREDGAADAEVGEGHGGPSAAIGRAWRRDCDGRRDPARR